MLGAIEFLSLVGYEVIVAYVMKAFSPMQEEKKKKYLFWALLPLLLMTMFHSKNIGKDYDAYSGLFNRAKNQTLAEALRDTRYEKGYLLFNYSLAKVFESMQSVMIAEGLIVYLCLARWIKKWCSAPGVFVCLLVEMLWIDSWISMMRQAIAMAILFFAFDELIDKHLIRFVLIVILAAQFHAVSYVFLLAYPMLYWFDEYRENKLGKFEKNWLFEKLMLVCTIGIALLFQPTLKFLLYLFPKYQYYMAGSYMDGQTRVAIIIKIIVYGMILVAPRVIMRGQTPNGKSQLACYRMAIVTLVITIAANQATILTRVSSVFSIYAIAGYAEEITNLKYEKNRRIMIFMTLLLFAAYGCVITVFRTPKWQQTYPFEWFWQMQ